MRDLKNEPKSKIEEMRLKYQILLKQNTKQEIEEKIPSPEQNKIVEETIQEIKNELYKMKNNSLQSEKRNSAYQMTLKIKGIIDYPMYMQQIEEINSTMNDEEYNQLKISTRGPLYATINMVRRKIVRKLAQLIDIKVSKIDDLKEIEELEKKIDGSMQQKYPMIVEGVAIKLKNKKETIQQQSVIENIKNSISPNLVSILKDIAGGVLNKENASEIIRQEAEKRLQSRKKSRFGWTIEQEEKQLVTQMMMVFNENCEEYNVVNPQKTLEKLQELPGVRLEDALNSVVKNLIERKDFEYARTICDENLENQYQNNVKLYVKTLKNQIRIAQIGDMVKKGLDKKGSLEEENSYFDMVKEGIANANIKITSIPIERSKDGLRNITLADIWPEKEEITR